MDFCFGKEIFHFAQPECCTIIGWNTKISFTVYSLGGVIQSWTTFNYHDIYLKMLRSTARLKMPGHFQFSCNGFCSLLEFSWFSMLCAMIFHDFLGFTESFGEMYIADSLHQQRNLQHAVRLACVCVCVCIVCPCGCSWFCCNCVYYIPVHCKGVCVYVCVCLWHLTGYALTQKGTVG